MLAAPIDRLLLGAGVAAVVAVVFGLVFAAGLGTGIALAAGAVIAGTTAALASRPTARSPATTPAAGAGADLAGGGTEEERLRRLRHDLRGILSPALLTADRLLASTNDPAVKRAAEMMIETVERANARLTARPTS